eukprot:243114-Prorocentrum_lima.AAC.1
MALLSRKQLAELGVVLDLQAECSDFKAFGANGATLPKSANGHTLLDLCFFIPARIGNDLMEF